MPTALRARAIPDAVAEVLRAAQTDGPRLVLPDKLDRKLYVQVNEVLEAIGGAWNRKAKAHLFPSDAAACVAAALGDGAYVRDADNGYFPTPGWIAEAMCVIAAVKPGSLVLEPSAGEGAIADAAQRRGAFVFCVELDPKRCAVLRGVGPTSRFVHEGDFLAWADERGGGSFPIVLMNPPFAGGEGVDHVMRAWELLAPGGTLVAVMPSGVTFRQDRRHTALRQLAATVGHIEPLPDGAFEDAGTLVHTVLVVLQK